MSRSVLFLLVALVALGLPAWQVVAALRRGVDLRRIPRVLLSIGPMGLLRTNWYALLMMCVGAIILPLGINGYRDSSSYSSAPACMSTTGYECRDLRSAVVAGVGTYTSKSGQETTVDFADGLGSATFYSDAVAPASVAKGTTVTVEVWHGKVTAVLLDGAKHQSFATQSDAWILIPLAVGILLLSLMSLALNGSITQSPIEKQRSDPFVAPVGRRYALYALVGLFALLSAILAAGGLFEAAGVKSLSGNLYGIAFFGFLLDLAVFPVFVAWFWRAYQNLAVLGRKPAHSWPFVLLALVVPPLILFMPYRLIGELVAKSRAPIARSWIAAWWASALAWLVIFVAGGSIGSANVANAQILSDVAIVACLLPAVVVSFLTLVIVREVDRAQIQLASPDSAPAVYLPSTHEPAPSLPPPPRIPVDQLNEARRSSLPDRIGIRPSLQRGLRQMRTALPAFVIVVAIAMLRGLLDNTHWLLWIVPTLLVAIAAGWYLWFRNASLFSGSGYFGRTNLLGQRLAYPLADLRRVLIRMVTTNRSATPRIILIGEGNRILFQVNPNTWDPGDMQRFLDSLNAKPEEDLSPIGYWSLKRQLRDGRT